MVKITVQGNETNELVHEPKMTLGYAIKITDIVVEKATTFTINGKPVEGWRKMRTRLNDGDEIVVIPAPGNG